MQNIFNSWINNVNIFNQKFLSGKPFEHVVIDNFFNDEYAELLYNNFPDVADKNWFSYWNPIEKKYAMNNFSESEIYNNLFLELQSNDTLELVKKISGINNLEIDKHLHGAGVHYHPKGGKLDMHLDYSIHPISGKERRVNLIIYMNKNWKDEYHGDVQFWNKEFTECESNIYPVFNRAVLFRTSDISWHGLPTPINCPSDMRRKSIAIYYVSEPRENVTHRKKASFRPLPWQPVDYRLEKLYKIRKERVIKKSDLDEIYPNWESDGNGFW